MRGVRNFGINKRVPQTNHIYLISDTNLLYIFCSAKSAKFTSIVPASHGSPRFGNK